MARKRVTVVGAGLAGQVMAMELRAMEADVQVLDNLDDRAASRASDNLFDYEWRRSLGRETMDRAMRFYLRHGVDLGRCRSSTSTASSDRCTGCPMGWSGRRTWGRRRRWAREEA